MTWRAGTDAAGPPTMTLWIRPQDESVRAEVGRLAAAFARKPCLYRSGYDAHSDSSTEESADVRADAQVP